MSGKNHLIPAFKISEETYKAFEEAIIKTNMRKTDLSRLLFNRALKELRSIAQTQGWENLSFSIKEMN
jgi:hypothetical protein